VTAKGDLPEAVAGQAVTLTLTDEIDISRGDMLSAPDLGPLHTRYMKAHLVWLHDEPLQPGHSYLIKTATAVTPGRIVTVQQAVDVNTLEQKQATTLGLNEIGVVLLELDRPVPLDPYHQNRHTGSFILIDRYSNATVAAGMVISAAPEGEPAGITPLPAATGDASVRRINLGDWFISGDEGNLVDLTTVQEEIELDVTTAFIDMLSRGNRVLLVIRDPGQLPPVAALAFKHDLTFNFTRAADRVNIVLHKSCDKLL